MTIEHMCVEEEPAFGSKEMRIQGGQIPRVILDIAEFKMSMKAAWERYRHCTAHCV